MNKNNTDECIPCPAGDPWITCRSKSHHRRIYYYNTVTGEAIWNLTDFENDKCKKIAKVSDAPQDQSDNYPEPKEPPQDICRKILPSEANEQNMHKSGSISTIFKDYIMNQSLNEHSLSPNTKLQICDNINPITDFMFSIPLAPTSTPNHYISLINKPQERIELDHNNVDRFKNNYVHTTSVPLSERFQILQNVSNPLCFVIPDQEEKSTALNVSEINNSMLDETDSLCSKYQQSIVSSDLRQLLSLKRQSNSLNNIEQQIECNSTKINSVTTGTCDFSNLQTDINKKQLIDTDVDAGVQYMGSKFEDSIYLVPDANVFQCHSHFLQFLLKFGRTFHFLVLENVVADIRNNSRSFVVHIRRRARLAMTFISKNIIDGFVTIVQNPINKKNTGPFYAVECCLKLVEKYNKTILLSNYDHMKQHEHADRIIILNVNELKSIVNTFEDVNLIKNKLYPNETCLDVSMQDVSNDEETVSDCDTIEEKLHKLLGETSTTTSPTKLSVAVRTSSSIEDNITVDASVQTDLDSELLDRILNTESVKNILADAKKIKETLHKDSYDSILKSWNIQLNSSTALTNNIENNLEQRNFKWRRKRTRNLFKQKQEIQSATKDTMVEIPKQIPEVQQYNRCISDDIQPTDGSSTSGVVSTAPSPNGYWSEYENTQTTLTSDKENEKDSNVMFEVSSPVMYENLKSRSDEWVSRFVQIMEEALTQVLTNPSQSPNVLAPPWTLFEATTCIKMKCRKDRDIVDAGNKLINTLTRINDKKGTVNIHPTPKQYMEMYSYGVYLIDTLQAAFEGCEDLQTASESLSKLLNDIQYPNLSTSQNDTVTSVHRDETTNNINIDSKEKVFLTNNEKSLIHQKKLTVLSPISSPLKRKLESNFKNYVVEERENDVKCVEQANTNISLLSTLDLNNYNDVCDKESVISFMDDEPHTPLYDPPTIDEVKTAEDISNASTMNIILPTNSIDDLKQQKVILNFTQCADYEDKLKKQRLELNDDSGESCLDDTSDDEGDYESDGEGTNDKKNFGFDDIFNNMLLEVRRTFIIVFAFCMTCQKALNLSDPGRKLLEAKEVYSLVTNICNVLSRIIKRDDKLFVSHIAEVLNAEDVMEDFQFDESDLKKYKVNITKYLEQGNILRECLTTILRHTQSVE